MALHHFNVSFQRFNVSFLIFLILKWVTTSPNQVLTHAARAAALVRARLPWSGQGHNVRQVQSRGGNCQASKTAFRLSDPPFEANRSESPRFKNRGRVRAAYNMNISLALRAPLRDATYEVCERGDLSEFLAARTCASCWVDKGGKRQIACLTSPDPPFNSTREGARGVQQIACI